MGFTIQRFVIRGLHKTRDYDIPIRDNRIVMVGVNGLGKTTVVDLLYLILSRQWDRVLEYTFDAISLLINGVEYNLKQEQDGDFDDSSVANRLRTQLVRIVPREQFQSIPLEIFERLASLAMTHGKDVMAAELDRMTSIPLRLPKVCIHVQCGTEII